MEEKIYEYVLVGPGNVGKTSIITRYTDNVFMDNTFCTNGTDMISRRICNFPYDPIHISVWDTAGQEKYISLTRNSVKLGNCILLCFSLASESSFEECRKFLDEIKNNKRSEAIILLVGTFLDMKNSCRNIDRSEIEKLCEENQLIYFEVSSLTGEGINELFSKTIELMDEKKLYKTKTGYISMLYKYTNPYNLCNIL